MKNVLFVLFMVVSSKCLAGEKIPVVDIFTLKSLPRLPILAEGCEGECCGLLKSQKVLADINLAEGPGRGFKNVGVIKKGEVLDSVEFFIKILKFGSTKVNGKKLKVLTYMAEGNVSIWDGKKVRATECTSGGDICDDNLKQAATESWLRIKTKRGVTGWANISARGDGILDYDSCH